MDHQQCSLSLLQGLPCILHTQPLSVHIWLWVTGVVSGFSVLSVHQGGPEWSATGRDLTADKGIA